MKQLTGKQLRFAKVKKDAIIPTKKNENGGFDLYACFKEDYILINPHETKLIPTGIASACSEDYALILKERGSTGTKGMAQRCGVVDSSYRGEIFCPITNTTNKPIVIVKKEAVEYLEDIYTIYTYPYEKAISQILVVEVPQMEVEEITFEELQSIPSERGDGCLGSSGK